MAVRPGPAPRGPRGTQQILANSQQQAIAAADARGRFEMSCPEAQGSAISRELTQPMIQGPFVGGLPRPEYSVGVEGCGQREAYLVTCPPDGGGYFAAGARPVPGLRRRGPRMVRRLGALALAMAATGTAPSPAPAQETTIDIVATSLRARGYTCERPGALEADPAHLRPDERAWFLTCETGRYGVIRKGDTGPEVERLGG